MLLKTAKGERVMVLNESMFDIQIKGVMRPPICYCLIHHDGDKKGNQSFYWPRFVWFGM